MKQYTKNLDDLIGKEIVAIGFYNFDNLILTTAKNWISFDARDNYGDLEVIISDEPKFIYDISIKDGIILKIIEEYEAVVIELAHKVKLEEIKKEKEYLQYQKYLELKREYEGSITPP